MFGGTAATKATLVKRSVKEENTESHPSKRVKVEAEGGNDLESDIKKAYDKGGVSKVSKSHGQYRGV
jgi:hypothetical protein